MKGSRFQCSCVNGKLGCSPPNAPARRMAPAISLPLLQSQLAKEVLTPIPCTTTCRHSFGRQTQKRAGQTQSIAHGRVIRLLFLQKLPKTVMTGLVLVHAAFTARDVAVENHKPAIYKSGAKEPVMGTSLTQLKTQG